MSITQRDLAKLLGVAQVTVSRALRNDSYVSKSLRRRILKAAERHGYSIDSSHYEARLMRQRAVGVDARTNVICAIIAEDEDPDGFNARILRGMNREGEVIGSEIVVITRCRRDLPLIVARRQVDGAVRMLSDVDLAKGFARPPVPWVSILFDVPDVDVVATDDFGGAREVGRYLCGKGHQRIAFIGPEIALARQRLAGLRAAASEAGTDVPNDLVRLQPFVASEGPTRALLDTFIGRRTDALPFTALVAYNDFMAAIAMQFLAARGLRIPEDVSVAGFDGLTPLPFRDSRRIASAAIPLTEIGAAAVRLLEWRLGAPNAPCRKVVIETTLVNGDTVGAPRR